jgi:ribosome-binding factor A
MTTRRQQKVASTILKELSLIISRKVSDPRVVGVHLVSVDVSPDLHLARIYFSSIAKEKTPEEVQRGLDSAKPFLRKELKKVIQLRTVPELAFNYDPAIQEGDRMLDLLNKLNNPDNK